MIDSHCHLGIDDFKEDIDGCLMRAKDAGVSSILTVACDYNHLDDLINMSKYEGVYTAFGIHPENAKSYDYEKVKSIFLKYPNINALGEIGLDFFYNLDSKKEQLEAFRSQIHLASEIKKTIIIHTRDADDDTMDILKDSYNKNLLQKGGVMHCFCGSENLAKTALDVGFYISFSGIITFKNAQNLRDVLKEIPLDRLLVETDAPYLAPVPYRGKRNEPAYLPNTLKCMAEIKGEPIEKIIEYTTKNFFNLFKGE